MILHQGKSPPELNSTRSICLLNGVTFCQDSKVIMSKIAYRISKLPKRLLYSMMRRVTYLNFTTFPTSLWKIPLKHGVQDLDNNRELTGFIREWKISGKIRNFFSLLSEIKLFLKLSIRLPRNRQKMNKIFFCKLLWKMLFFFKRI